MLRVRIGDFYITEQIGAGGMAEVYLAIHPQTGEKRAIKVMKKRAIAGSAGYERFLREVELIRNLSHPNIVRVMESGVLDDCFFYSMEYAQAGSLARRIAKFRLPLEEVMDILSSACRGMAFAHQKGVVHRDLKPANILIGDSGDPKISDFGIAKQMGGSGPDLTKSNEVMGTVAYLSPEQRFDTKEVDRRTDVYSLGAIFYEMVMGFPPLGKFPLPSELQPDFPLAVQSIIETCLMQRREDRFADAGELADALDRFRKSGGETMILAPDCTKQETVGYQKPDSDRIEEWLRTLRTGTTNERLSAVGEMIKRIQPGEIRTALRLFPTEGDRVRWGLIRLFGERRVTSAARLIISELNNSFQRECALDALGKIGEKEAFEPIRDLLVQRPELAHAALIPLARTGGPRAIPHVVRFLEHEMGILRESAVRALACIGTEECLRLLNRHAGVEPDQRIRAETRAAIREITVRSNGSENKENEAFLPDDLEIPTAAISN